MPLELKTAFCTLAPRTWAEFECSVLQRDKEENYFFGRLFLTEGLFAIVDWQCQIRYVSGRGRRCGESPHNDHGLLSKVSKMSAKGFQQEAS